MKDRSIDTIRPPLYPPVYITNAALAHSITHDIQSYTTMIQSIPLVQFWRNYHKQHSSTSPAKPDEVLKIYQSSSAMHGKRNFGFSWMNEVFRRQNKVNRDLFIHEFNFMDFDEWALTAAKPDYGDGWHYYSVPLKMNAMILLNMLCLSS